MDAQLELLHEPPAFCQYASGPCDQSFDALPAARGLFLYSSQPPQIAATIEAAAAKLGERSSDRWGTWKDLDIGGQIIFCEICKAMRGASTVFADVTTLNFNLLFEIGFCMGLSVPVVPIRDPTYSVDRKAFDAIGVLDTVGYTDFTNAEDLATEVLEAKGGIPVANPPKRTYSESPVYFLKGPIETEGAVRLFSTLKKSPLRFRTHDPVETPRLSLQRARKQVSGSFGVFAHLLSPKRDGALVHNGLCALLCGMALAEQKAVLLLQEEGGEQPIDYRDLVQTYRTPDEIPSLLADSIDDVIARMQDFAPQAGLPPEGVLDRLDLGDTAAENEIPGLKSYFVRTAPYRQALNGHARLIVGRKGAGKTALFYGLRTGAQRGGQTLVLDMKPEGHQFTRLREAVLDVLGPGSQEYVITAFWTYLLSAETAHKIINSAYEHRVAERDPERFARYEALAKAYRAHGLTAADDMPQRFLRQVDRLEARVRGAGDITVRTDLAEMVYGGDIRTLNDAVGEFLVNEKDQVWLLIDNLDKSWATRGSTPEDILILRGLLDAASKLSDQYEDRGVEFYPVVFIRTDIYDNLVRHSPDRGKDGAVSLDWDDPEVFKEIVRQRIAASTDLTGSFEDAWPGIVTPHVAAEESFGYLLARTLRRPRDLLNFVQASVDVALNRGHSVVTADDIRQAEIGYSEDTFLGLVLEVDDTNPPLANALYGFHGSPRAQSLEQVRDVLVRQEIPEDALPESIDLLLWFGFLGVATTRDGVERYAYDVRFNTRRLQHLVDSGDASYVIHRAFRAALAIE